MSTYIHENLSPLPISYNIPTCRGVSTHVPAQALPAKTTRCKRHLPSLDNMHMYKKYAQVYINPLYNSSIEFYYTCTLILLNCVHLVDSYQVDADLPKSDVSEVVDGHFSVAVVAAGEGDPVWLVVLESITFMLFTAALYMSRKHDSFTVSIHRISKE